MTYVSREPQVLAVEALAALLRDARVVARRTVLVRALGTAYTSEIALPGDADYDAPGSGERLLKRVDAHSARGALTATESLPRAWVYPADAALGEDGARPADRVWALHVGTTIKCADTPERPGTIVKLRSRTLDLLRRIAVEKRGLGVPGIESVVGEPSTSYSPDGALVYVEFGVEVAGTSAPIEPPAEDPPEEED